jgi:hypothetical protein
MLFAHTISPDLMASQKVANCCVAAGKRACETPNCLVIAAYLCTPHSSKFARLAFDDFCLAISIDDFLRLHQIQEITECITHGRPGFSPKTEASPLSG